LLRRFLTIAAVILVRPVWAELPAPPPTEPGEIFDRAADALDRGDAKQARAQLDDLERRFPLPAWKLRGKLLLAHRDVEEGRPGAAAALEGLDARPIGLEPYRLYDLGRAREAAGDAAGAGRAYAAAAAERDSAIRARAALAAARLARTEVERREAAEVLAAAMDAARGDEVRDLLQARVRLASRLADGSVLRNAAADLVRLAPEWIDDRSLPAALRLEAANVRSRLSPERRLALMQRLLKRGNADEALREADSISEAALTAEGLRAWHLMRARALFRTGRPAAARIEAGRIEPDVSPESFEARLVEAESAVEEAVPRPPRRARHRRRISPEAPPEPETFRRLAAGFAAAASPDAPPRIRVRALRREIELWSRGGDRGKELEAARDLAAVEPGSTDGFEGLWAPVWAEIAGGACGKALPRLRELASVFTASPVRRRLRFWNAECLDRLGAEAAARALRRELLVASPPDLYSRFAGEAAPLCSGLSDAPPPSASGDFRRVDELVRLRLFADASREASRLPPSPGRELRRAIADFALGNFSEAASEVRSAFPQVGTAREGEVPEQWRRLFYPIDYGSHVETAAREFGLDPYLLLGLVRQESTFDPRARSHAGAVGLTQLMPGTARELSRPVLNRRFRKAFLYDPAINVRLGASYLRYLLDRFDGDRVYAVAAYNAGPGRIAALLREHPAATPPALLEWLPAEETRVYVRHVLLFAEAYRELYPPES